jgi:hypothetical protein
MKRIITILVILFAGTLAFAQSADVVTDILESDEATYGQVCYLSAIHQGLISEDADYEEAVEVLYNRGQIPENVSAYDSVFMANLAFIYVQIWPNIKGGLMFALTNGSPRYAFKKLKSDGVIPDSTDPKQIVTGREALNILTTCMLEYGTNECMEMDVE